MANTFFVIRINPWLLASSLQLIENFVSNLLTIHRTSFKVCYPMWPSKEIPVHCGKAQVFETAFGASWKLNQLFSDDSLSLRDFRRHTTVVYTRLSFPRKPSCRKLGVQYVNESFLNLKNKLVIVKKPEN
ncbi:hypothetical protein AVEN_138510-1 [Araneus ventricosus]|uniref:Uncharacterized protein n=1 Tax=Araneus ventricosus TaxID=182803 RepID=A0A4Y2AP99_ARAVE|nr:hypothetical protein AVEN_74457-1 [Araneus ventricosus]GBL81075.1 hypothetical protein AVEN_120406-1 [Araneus ventricosus]GBL81084.1 hypothetical protein AVEN_127496-1 [Araneus ventricosus]GBL81089.1 hypothetical protein AVEN_138510-1 [Araneus ventricosus]